MKETTVNTPKVTTTIPMSDPRHPMHARLAQEAWEREHGKPPESYTQPHQYEDQYGRMRWSHDHTPVHP